MVFVHVRPEIQILIADSKGVIFDPYYLGGEKYIQCSIEQAKVLQVWKNSYSSEQFLVGFHSLYEHKKSDVKIIDGYYNTFSSWFLLQDEMYYAQLRHIQEQFAEEPELALHSTGDSFPSVGTAARLFCESLLTSIPSNYNSIQPNPLCICMPHIDFRMTTEPYKHVFSLLRTSAPKTIVLIGTSHYKGSDNELFFTTGKNINTPLGTIEIQREIINDIRRSCGSSVSLSEWMFRAEYSLDYCFYAIKYLFPDARVVPILIGNFDKYLTDGKNIDQWSKLEKLIEILHELYSQNNDDVLIIVSGDGGHRGKTFGDSLPAKEYKAAQAFIDEQYSSYLVECAPERLWELLQASQNKERICGFAPHYVALKVLDKEHIFGKQLYYSQIEPTHQDSLLTIGVWAFYR